MRVVNDVIRRMVFPMLMASIVASLWTIAEIRTYQADLRADSLRMELPGIEATIAPRPMPVWFVVDDTANEGAIDPT